ncbi:MAG: cell division protein FtsQ/DivIB [Planctomycetota bacterium]|jgi:hypothetical protein
MAKRKTTKKGGLFSFFSKKKKTGRRSKKNQPNISSGVKVAASILFVAILAAGGAIGLIYMDRSIKQDAIKDTPLVSLRLIGRPDWIENQQVWIDTVTEVAGGGAFAPNADTAQFVQQRLESLSWMSNVTVQTTPEYINVTGDYRRPVGLIDLGRGKKYLVAKDMTVLEYLPIDSLPIIEITGVDAVKSIPEPGRTWRAEDAAAAVQLLDYLYRCDTHFLQQEKIQKPLLDEIVAIDVSNFAARSNKPHIFLKVTDGTKVNWGAAIGQAARFLEQNEKDKIADLYDHFIDYNNTLMGSAKYIELRQL